MKFYKKKFVRGIVATLVGVFLTSCTDQPPATPAPQNPPPSAPVNQPPSVPQNLTAQTLSSSEIALAWQASSDDVGIAGYFVFRDGAQIASTQNTMFTDTGLAADTLYNYRVRAFDGESLQSGNSNVASATTLSDTTTDGRLQQSRPSRGYTAQGCSFDMDDDGVIGEADDDCNVGDGVTTDPDGDGIAEDLIYVDCDAGQDVLQCGAPGSPCGTIEYAWNTIADGPGDGAEDIIAFSGICTPTATMDVTFGGVTGTYVRPQSGSEARDWQLPSDPTMLIGWDRDNDGVYPPFDTDDVAIIDGSVHNLQLAFETTGEDYLELAHHSVTGFGVDLPTRVEGPSGYWKGRFHNYIYFHDLSLSDILRDSCSSGGYKVFDQSGGNDWYFVENIECQDCGGYFTRSGGGFASDPAGPYRFQNISLANHGRDDDIPNDTCSASGFTQLVDLWAYQTGIEIIDNIFDANTQNWTPANRGGGLEVSVCSSDWHIVNNEFYNYRGAIGAAGVEGITAPCDPNSGGVPRTTGPVFFSGNYIFHNNQNATTAPISLRERPTDSTGIAETRLEDITIANNVVFTGPDSPGYPQFLFVSLQHNDPSIEYVEPVRILNNTFHSSGGTGVVFEIQDDIFPVQAQRFEFKNNLITGLDAASRNVITGYAPTEWDVDGNVYDPNARFIWNLDGFTPSIDFSDWQTASGGDAQSQTCTPTYVDAVNGDLHLDPSDNCARNAGVAVQDPAAIPLDFDGQPRTQGSAPDVGADETDN